MTLHDDPNDGRVPIQIDAFVPIKPQEVDDPDASSWSAVGAGLMLSLRRFVARTGCLIAEIPQGARRLLKGSTSLPEAAAKRIEGVHQSTDRSEIARQARHNEGTLRLPPNDAGERLLVIVAQLQAKGLAVRIIEGDAGQFAIAIARPELGEMAIGLANSAARQLTAVFSVAEVAAAIHDAGYDPERAATVRAAAFDAVRAGANVSGAMAGGWIEISQSKGDLPPGTPHPPGKEGTG